MQLLQLKNDFVKQLTNQYGEQESEQFFYMLSEAYLGYTKIDIALNPSELINVQKHELFSMAFQRLEKNEPIQHIIGSTYFYGNNFVVNEHTLIPRPETEELIDWIVKDTENKPIHILDIGTGSGCIAISLAQKLTKASVSAIDVSQDALVVANLNAHAIKVAIDFKEQDILKAEKLFKDFDIVVSNPPYVRDSEKKEMSANVLNFEPDSALFVSDTDPLVFYYKIAELFLAQAKKTAVLYFEINEYLGQELIDGLKQLGFSSVELRQDFRGKDRMIKASI